MPTPDFSERDTSRSNSEGNPAAVRLLRGAAALTGLVGLMIAAWLADKAVRYPEVRAAQFDASAPLWIPFIVFVLACTGLMVYIFVRAARRLQRGEDLFALRHRRRPSEDEPAPSSDAPRSAASNGTAS